MLAHAGYITGVISQCKVQDLTGFFEGMQDKEIHRFLSCDPQVLTIGCTETKANRPKSDQSLSASNSAVPPCQIGITPHKPFFHWMCREAMPQATVEIPAWLLHQHTIAGTSS